MTLPILSDNATSVSRSSNGCTVSARASARAAPIDMVRGLAIISIIGADQLSWAMRGMFEDESRVAQFSRALAAQFEHATWEGLRFYDLVLPVLIFLAGVSAVFSLAKARENHNRLQLYSRVLRRAAVLYILGIVYYGGLTATWPDIRLLGVLQRIAACYLIAATLFLALPLRTLYVIVGVVLLGYWLAFELISLDEVQAGTFLPEINLAHAIDRKYLPGKLWYGTWDPEGLTSTLPAICTCLLGVFAGLLLTEHNLRAIHKASWLVFIGSAALAAGTVWSFRFPVIKALWTSSYVLITAGYSCLFLALAYLLADVWRLGGFLNVFLWVGANAITLYLLEGLIGFAKIAETILGHDLLTRLDGTSPGLSAALSPAIGLAIAVCLARYLYAKRVFLRM